MVTLISVLLFSAVSDVVDARAISHVSLPSNAKTYQRTPTYDGSGQAVHPSVIYFPKAWNGYQYWMAMTPYPSSKSRYENPSILGSNDGKTWVVPSGLTNPIDSGASIGGAGTYTSDPELFYNASNDRLICYYRWCNSTRDRLYCKCSSDGVTWSNRVLLMTGEFGALIAPSVQLVGSTYYMWVNNDTPGASRGNCAANKIVRYSSNNGTKWGSATICSILGKISGGRYEWHGEVRYANNTYIDLMDSSTGNTPSNNILIVLESSNGVTWTISSDPFLSKSRTTNTWDSTGIYRSTFVLFGNTMDIWYSAFNSKNPHMGFTSANLSI
jgi:hypothetical protein